MRPGRQTRMITDAPDTTLTIAFLGLPARDRQLFESFLGILEGRVNLHPRICKPGEPVDVLVVDADVLATGTPQRLPPARTLVCYGDGPSPGGVECVTLARPVRFWDLQTLLASLSGTQEQGSKPVAKPDTRPGRLYDLLSDCDRSAALTIDFREFTLMTDPGRNRYYFPTRLVDLEPICRAPASELQIRPATAAGLGNAARTLQSGPLVRLWWEAAISGSQGKLPAPVTIETPVSLRRWPDLGVLRFRDHYPLLCAQIARRPVSPAAISQRTNVAISDVAAFLSACMFCGYLNIEDARAAHARDGAGRKPADKGLFSRIRRRLGLGSTAAN